MPIITMSVGRIDSRSRTAQYSAITPNSAPKHQPMILSIHLPGSWLTVPLPCAVRRATRDRIPQ